MNVKGRLHSFFLSFLTSPEIGARKLALSFCMGVYIAISPFVGLHTAMVLFCSWIFRLNIAVVWGVSVCINNPWTMAFVYFGDYVFGEFIFGTLCGINMKLFNPVWMNWFNNYLFTYTGIAGISLWSFIIGGNILACASSLILYPLVKRIFEQLIDQKSI